MKTMLQIILKVCFLVILLFAFSISGNAQRTIQIYPKAIKKDKSFIIFKYPGTSQTVTAYTGQNSSESAFTTALNSTDFNNYQGIFRKTFTVNESATQKLTPGPVTLSIANSTYNWRSTQFTLLPDSAAATFTRTDIQQNWTGGRLQVMTMADLDGDGYEDILAYAYENHRILWRRNNSGKSWSGIKTIATWSTGESWSSVSDITAADIDADGDNDIVFPYKNNISIIKNNGDGTFGSRVDYPMPDNSSYNYSLPRAKYISIHDLNGDGLQDVLWYIEEQSNSNGYASFVYRTIGYSPMQSNGTLGTAIILTGCDASPTCLENYGISAGRYDNFWVQIPTPQGGIYVRPANRQVSIGTTATGSFNVDWNSDGVMEIENFPSVAIDVDADGDMDKFAFSSGDIRYYENTSGTGTFPSSILIGAKATCNSCGSNNYLSMETTDFDHDGDMDLVAINQRGFYVFENIWKGNSLFSVSNSEFTGNQTKEGNTFIYEVDSTTDLTSINLEYHISGGATGVAALTDFTSPVTYSITSEEGGSQDWVVDLIKIPSRIEPVFDVSQTRIEARWIKEKYASKYKIEIENITSSGTPQVSTISAPDSDTVSYNFLDLISQINPNTNYRISITAINQFDSPSKVYSEEIQTLPQSPTSLTLVAASVTRSAFEVTWIKRSNDAADRVKIYQGETLVIDSILNVSINTFLATELQPGTYYTVYVSSVNGQNRSSEAIDLEIVTGPLSPTLIEIATKNILIDSVFITWNRPSGVADEFELTITPAGSSTDPIGSIVDTSYYYTGFSLGKIHKVKVRARNISNPALSNDIYSEFSNEVEFLTRPLAPTLSVFGASDITNSSFVVSWNPVESATFYGVEVSSDGFQTIDATVINIAATNALVTGLAGGKNYSYRVQAFNASGSSRYSSTSSVLTAPSNPVMGEVFEITSNTAKANWGVVTGANGYLIDVSNTDFITYVSGFNQRNTVSTETSIAGLQPGTEYKIRTKAYNGSATSSYSDTLTFITIPSLPFNLATSNITLQSARCSWNNPGGVDSYDFQLSSTQTFSDTLFQSSTSSTNIDLTGLTQRTVYYFRVRANNASGSSAFESSNFETDGEENIAPTGINLSNRSIDENIATGTFVGKLTTTDANTVESFTYTFVGTGNDNSSFSIKEDSLFTSGSFNFETKSTYQIEIRTTDSGGLTYIGSLEITIRDINDAPTNLSLSNNETVAYSAIGTTIGTLSASDEDAGDSQTYSIDTGGDAFEIDGNTLKNSVIFTNEEDSTVTLTLRATDSKGAFTTASQEILIQKFIDLELPVISSLSDPKDFAIGSAPITLSVEVSDFRISTVIFKTRALTAEDFETTDVSTQTSPYTITISEGDFDGVGMEFYVTATDASGNIAESEKRKISLSFSEASSPAIESITRFGGKVEDYEIISIPFVFEGTGNRVQEIFNEYNGGIPDKTIWRLIKYNPSATPDVSGLEDLVASSPVKIGEGYFFNAKEAAEVKIGSAQVNTTDPQEIVLRPGWNLIGNPYAVDINWSAVLTRNGIPEVGPLRVLDPNDPARWPESTQLEKFKGAFVNLMSESNKTITITYADKTPTGGRTSTIERPDYDWYLPLTLEQGDNQGSGSIGMHQQAKVGVDQFDALTLPRWLRYLEITFDHPEYAFSSFSKDIVSVADSYSWEFEVRSDQAGLSKLHWGDAFGNISNLKLLDVAEDRIIDMLSQPGYAFDLQGKKSFKIFFSQDPDDLFTSERISIGDAYPNPFEKQVNIPISLPEHDEDFNVKLEVIDLTGRVFWKVEDQMPSGLYEFTMERPAAMTSGLYLYRLTVLSKGVELEFTKKFVVE